MKLDHTWIQVEPGWEKNKKKNGNIKVLACSMYIDQFGKYHTSKKIFDEYTFMAQIMRDKDKLEAQANNCLEKPFYGWKL